MSYEMDDQFKYDTRLVSKHLQRNLISKKDFSGWLSGLPDEKEYDYTQVFDESTQPEELLEELPTSSNDEPSAL